jgi:hypothetical protein
VQVIKTFTCTEFQRTVRTIVTGAVTLLWWISFGQEVPPNFGVDVDGGEFVVDGWYSRWKLAPATMVFEVGLWGLGTCVKPHNDANSWVFGIVVLFGEKFWDDAGAL